MPDLGAIGHKLPITYYFKAVFNGDYTYEKSGSQWWKVTFVA
jgi:hypothetical protein